MSGLPAVRLIGQGLPLTGFPPRCDCNRFRCGQLWPFCISRNVREIMHAIIQCLVQFRAVGGRQSHSVLCIVFMAQGCLAIGIFGFVV